jgi:hypothetical protein
MTDNPIHAKILDRHLDSLPRFDPSPGFEDRVMSRVLVPPPSWIQSLQRGARSWVESRRIRWLAFGLLGTSTVSLTVLAILILAIPTPLSRAIDWMNSALGIPAWRAFIGIVSDSVRSVYVCLSPLQLSRSAALLVAVAAVGFLVIDVLALRLAMRPGRMAGAE